MKTEFVDVNDTRKNVRVEIPSDIVDAEIERQAKALPADKIPFQMHQWVDRLTTGDEPEVAGWVVAERLLFGRGELVSRSEVKVPVLIWDYLRAAFVFGVAVGNAMVGVPGGVLFTLKEALGPNAATTLPAMSLAVLAGSEMLKMPVPVIFVMTTVLTVALLVTTSTLPEAEPILFTVTLAGASVMLFKPDPPTLSLYVNV